MSPPPPPIRVADPPLVHRLRGGFWVVWIGLSVVLGVALHRLFERTQAPDACRIGFVALIPENPAGVGVLVRSGGGGGEAEGGAETFIPPIFGDHPDCVWWSWRLVPLDVAGNPSTTARLQILRVEAEKWDQPLAHLAPENQGWFASEGGGIAGPIETVQGAPILINGFALWQRVVLRTGPEQSKVRVEDLARGTTRVLDLRAATPGEATIGVVGARELMLAFDVPRIDQPVRFRVATPSGKEAQILRVWSTRGPVALDASRRQGTWTPPAPPIMNPPALAAILIACAVAAWPLVLWYRRTKLGPDAGCALAIVLWSAGYAGLLMLLYAPAIIVPDSTTRATHVASMIEGNPVAYWTLVHWFPPGHSVWLAVVHMLTGGQAWGVFLGAWWLYASLGLLGLVAGGRWVGAIVLTASMLMPNVATHAVALLPDAPTAAALCTIAAALLWAWREGRAMPRWGWCLCIAAWMLSVLVLLTFRANALTTLAVLVPAAWWALRRVSRWRAISAIAWCGVCLWFASALPTMIPWKKLDTLSASLVWEHVGMLKLANDPTLTERHTIDEVGRYTHATRRALEKHDWITHDALMWRAGSSLETQLVTALDSPVRARWRALVRERPGLYLRMKWEVALSLLGVRHHIPLTVVVPWEVPWETAYGVDVQTRGLLGGVGERIARTPPTPQALSWNAWSITQWIDTKWPWLMPLYVPYAWIGLAGVLGVVALVRGRLRAPVVLLLLLAASYYGAFFVIAPGMHWRYFMPAFVLLVVAIAVLVRDLLCAPCDQRQEAWRTTRASAKV